MSNASPCARSSLRSTPSRTMGQESRRPYPSCVQIQMRGRLILALPHPSTKRPAPVREFPRPIHPIARETNTCGHAPTNPNANVESPVSKYPATATGLRKCGRSATHPPASFAKLETPSATPSMIPSAYAGAPSPATKSAAVMCRFHVPSRNTDSPDQFQKRRA